MRFIKKTGREWRRGGDKKRGKQNSSLQQQLIPPLRLLCFVYGEKIPLMPRPNQTVDQVHEWHLSEPRVNPLIRGNLPKGLCSWEKCLLQRGMQKIPGRTGSPLLAVWRDSGANKSTQNRSVDARNILRKCCSKHSLKHSFLDKTVPTLFGATFNGLLSNYWGLIEVCVRSSHLFLFPAICLN